MAKEPSTSQQGQTAKPSGKGKGKAKGKAEPVFLDWHLGRNRGADIATPLDLYDDQLSELPTTEQAFAQALTERYHLLRDRPVTYSGWAGEEDRQEDTPTELLDGGWVLARDPEAVAKELQCALAQRDAAIGTVERVRQILESLGDRPTPDDAQNQDQLNRIRALEEQVNDLLADKITLEDERTALQRELLDLHRAARTSTQRRSTSPSGSDTPEPVVEAQGSRVKTAKIADPDKFTDGVDPKYSVWKAALLRKIKGNSELFPTEDSKFGYALSYIGGEAMEGMESRLEDDCPADEKITTLQDIFDHLEPFYKDPTELPRAKKDFADLQMAKTPSYRDFVTQFVRLATKARVPRSEWKYEFNARLTSKLQYGMTRDYIDETVRYDEFARLGHQYALQYEFIKQKSGDKKKSPSGGGSGGSPAPKDSNPREKSKSGTPTAGRGKSPTPQANEREKLMGEGKCFYCKEPGHIKADCPKLAAANIRRIETRPKDQDSHPLREDQQSEN